MRIGRAQSGCLVGAADQVFGPAQIGGGIERFRQACPAFGVALRFCFHAKAEARRMLTAE